jgi:hypothetical protein
MGFAANDHFDQADALTKALRKVIAASTNTRLGEGDFSLEVLTVAMGCSDVPDGTCLKKIAGKTSARRFVWGTISVENQRVNAELHLYEEGRVDKKTEFSYQASMTDALDVNLLELASNALSELLGPLTYKVTVRASEKSGKILVDGKAVGELTNGQAIVGAPSGDHEFRLESSSHDSVNAKVRVRLDGSTRVRLDPEAPSADETAAPVETTKEPVTPVTPKAPAEAEGSDGSAQRTWAYATLGTGGVLLAAGGLAALRLNSITNDAGLQAYRDGLRSNEDACKEADSDREVQGSIAPARVRSLCSQGNTLEIAQIVLLAGGAVAAATGLTLLLTAPSKKAAAAFIQPQVNVGKYRTDVGLVMRF